MDVRSYVKGHRRRAESVRCARRAKAAEVRERLRPAVAALVREFGVTEVFLFGSLLSGELHDRSDVDIAVVGLGDDDYFAAVHLLATSLRVPVDLVPLEGAPETLRARVIDEGIRLHG